MATTEEVYRHFLKYGTECKNGAQRAAGMGTLSNVFMVAYRTGEIHVTARRRGTTANAAARAGIKRRKMDSCKKEKKSNA